MKEFNMDNLLGTLEGMSTNELDEMLHEELAKDSVDGDRVRLILKILEDRDDSEIVNTETIPGTSDRKPVHRKSPRSWWIKAASITVIAGLLLFALPQEAEAENVFKRIARWTDSVFELINPGEDRTEDEYIFKTDHPGLQQVYDAVVELGVTEPVMPMWLPEGYELVECKTTYTPVKTYLQSVFSSETQNMVYKVTLYTENVTSMHYKDEAQATSYEIDGVTYNIVRNIETWTVIWISDNIECSIFIDCQEDVLYKILKSI